MVGHGTASDIENLAMTMKALLFDVDGTIADTEALGHRPAYNRAFRELGLSFRWGPKLYRKLLKQPGGRERLKYYFQHYQPELGAHQQEAQTNIDAWVGRVHELKSHYFRSYMRRGRVPLRPGVARLMREARIAGLQLAIVTNASRKTLNPVLLYSLGPEMLAEISVIACGEEVINKKPAPDIYQLAVQRLGLQPNECVALEDSEMGLEAAAAAGVKVVVTVNSDTLEQDFAEASLVVGSLGEPGAPTRVLKGELMGHRWVSIEALAHLCDAPQTASTQVRAA